MTDLIRVSAFYRTGKMSLEGRSCFTDELDTYLQTLIQKQGDSLLVGDFNVHVENRNDLDTHALLSTTESYGYQQMIHEPTHQKGGTLDLVFVKKTSDFLFHVQNSLVLYDLCHSVTSDHCFI